MRLNFTFQDGVTFAIGLIGALGGVFSTAINDVPGDPEKLQTWLVSLGIGLGSAAVRYAVTYLFQELADGDK